MIEETQVTQAALLMACAMLVDYNDRKMPIQIRDEIRAEIAEDATTDDEPMTPERLEELALAFACEALADQGVDGNAYQAYQLEESLKEDMREIVKG